MGTALAAGGAGLLGGMLIEDMIEDGREDAYRDGKFLSGSLPFSEFDCTDTFVGYEDAERNDYDGGGGFDGGDFGGDF